MYDKNPALKHRRKPRYLSPSFTPSIPWLPERLWPPYHEYIMTLFDQSGRCLTKFLRIL